MVPSKLLPVLLCLTSLCLPILVLGGEREKTLRALEKNLQSVGKAYGKVAENFFDGGGGVDDLKKLANKVKAKTLGKNGPKAAKFVEDAIKKLEKLENGGAGRRGQRWRKARAALEKGGQGRGTRGRHEGG